MNEERSGWQSPHLKAVQRLDGSGSKNKWEAVGWQWGGPVPAATRDGIVSGGVDCYCRL